MPRDIFDKLSLGHQQAVVQKEQQEMFKYRKWPAVLEALGLETPVDYEDILRKAACFRGGGESEQHKRLKHYIATHPGVLQLPATAGEGAVEFRLPSGDSLDVLFESEGHWTAVEVKSSVSDTPDIVRGMFQCVKYRAVIEAHHATQNLPQSVRIILVIESSFPADLDDMKNILGIEVVDRVRPQ